MVGFPHNLDILGYWNWNLHYLMQVFVWNFWKTRYCRNRQLQICRYIFRNTRFRSVDIWDVHFSSNHMLNLSYVALLPGWKQAQMTHCISKCSIFCLCFHLETCDVVLSRLCWAWTGLKPIHWMQWVTSAGVWMSNWKEDQKLVVIVRICEAIWLHYLQLCYFILSCAKHPEPHSGCFEIALTGHWSLWTNLTL